MLAGREYGAGSSDCPTCETHSPTLDIQKCARCETWGCQFCLSPGPFCSECAEVFSAAKEILHVKQSMMGRWMDMGERAEYLEANLSGVKSLGDARMLALKVDTV